MIENQVALKRAKVAFSIINEKTTKKNTTTVLIMVVTDTGYQSSHHERLTRKITIYERKILYLSHILCQAMEEQRYKIMKRGPHALMDGRHPMPHVPFQLRQHRNRSSLFFKPKIELCLSK